MDCDKIVSRIVLSALIVMTVQGSLNAQTAPPMVPADYAGMIGGLHLMLHLRQSAGTGVTGTIDWTDQYRFGDQCAGIAESGKKFNFTVPDVQGSYQGEIGPDDNTITGIWTQGGSAPLVFTRSRERGLTTREWLALFI